MDILTQSTLATSRYERAAVLWRAAKIMGLTVIVVGLFIVAFGRLIEMLADL
jgi:hypothetical protein